MALLPHLQIDLISEMLFKILLTHILALFRHIVMFSISYGPLFLNTEACNIYKNII